MSMNWLKFAMKQLASERNRSADTHLLKIWIPSLPDVHLYLKDESTHRTRNLKHRLAQSLFEYFISSGIITEDVPVVEASSGSTALCEAYFAQLLDLRFIAVVSKNTSIAKIDRIKKYGGECYMIDDPTQDRATAAAMAKGIGGHFMDQFTHAERVLDWRTDQNIAASIFKQMRLEEYPIPSWIVCGAGTGATATTMGRHIKYNNYTTQLCVSDPENSVYYDYYYAEDRDAQKNKILTEGSRIQGIGRPRVEASFTPSVIDKMIKVPDAATIAVLYFMENLIGLRVGGSTGTNLYATFQLMAYMHKHRMPGSVVTILCDTGDFYPDTYYNPEWVKAQHLNYQPYLEQIEHFYNTGVFEKLNLS